MAFVPQPRNVEVIRSGAGHLLVRGVLTFRTARFAYEAGLRLLKKDAKGNAFTEIDCGDVTESDSAGLAVLIEWLAAAGRAGQHVRYANLPEGIRATAEISDVTSLLESGV